MAKQRHSLQQQQQKKSNSDAKISLLPYTRTQESSDNLNILFEENEFNTIYLVDYMPKFKQNLELLQKLQVNIRYHYLKKYRSLKDRLIKFNLNHDLDLCALLLKKELLTPKLHEEINKIRFKDSATDI